MDVNHVQNIWGALLLHANDIKLSCNYDDEIQGIIILLQVFRASVERLINRYCQTEKSLNVVIEERARFATKCSELQRALNSEKAKECSQCPNFISQLKSYEKVLAEKSKLCDECSKLWLKIKSQKKKIEEKEKIIKCQDKQIGENSKLFKHIMHVANGANPAYSTEDKYKTVLSYFSQMNFVEEMDDAVGFDEESTFPQKKTASLPKRKSPSFDKELDSVNPKRKSPCLESESHVFYIPKTIMIKKEEEDNFSTVKNIEEKKTRTESDCSDRNNHIIIVPETLEEQINPVNVVQNIVIPETVYAQDDFANLSFEGVYRTPEKQKLDRGDDGSPVLTASASKKIGKPNNANKGKVENEVAAVKTVKKDCISISKMNSNETSPSMLAMDVGMKKENYLHSNDLKALDEFLDKVGKSTANSLKRNRKSATDNSRNTPVKKSDAADKKLAALCDKNAVVLKEATYQQNEKLGGVMYSAKTESKCPKLKQTTLAFAPVSKNQDISNNNSFNGGVLAEPLDDDENVDSDGSECLVLPSPKNALNSSHSSFFSIKSAQLKTEKENNESNIKEQKGGTYPPSLDDTYFAPPITSTCFSLSKRNKYEIEEEDKNIFKEKPRKQTRDLSFDRVPNRTINSPKYKYEEDPVRKKNERKQLPGRECGGCSKYYAMVNKDGDDAQKHKDECSRHRSKHEDTNKTVAGFWDPELPDTPE